MVNNRNPIGAQWRLAGLAVATYEIAARAESCKRYDLTELYYRECARQFPNPGVSWKHGCVLALLGRAAEAPVVFAVVLSEDPGFEPARQSAAELPAQ